MNHISGLVKTVSERSLSRKKSQFLSKSGFVFTLILPSTTLGIFWVITPWICLIVYTLMNIYSRVGITHYYIACLSCLLLLRVNCYYKHELESSTRIYFNHLEQGKIWYPLVLDVWFLLHIGKYWFLVSKLSVVVHPKP